MAQSGGSRGRRPALLAALATLTALTLSACPGARDDDGTPTLCGLFGRDRDGDGLPDEVEDLDGDGEQDFGECDPNSPDGDRDGIADSIEVGCDARSEPGVETRCEVRDTDGDGLEDGEEDADRDGRFEPEAGETSPVLADTDGDLCSDGAELGYTDPNVADTDGDGLQDGAENADCDRVILDALCETDPTLPDTDGDGELDRDVLCPFEICPISPLSRRPVLYASSPSAGWRVALPAGSGADPTLWEEVFVAGRAPGDLASGAVADVRLVTPAGEPLAVLAFVAVLPLAGTGVTSAAAARAMVTTRLASAWPAAGDTLTLLARATIDTSWDGAPLARNGVLALAQPAAPPRDGAALRTAALAALLDVPAASVSASLPGTGVAPNGEPVVLAFEATLTAPDRLVVVGAIAAAADWDDESGPARPAAEDLASGRALAAVGDGETEWCGAVFGGGVQRRVDLLVVLDPAALPVAAPVSWAAALAARADRTGTLLRVGVTDTNDANGGALCPMGTDALLFPTDPTLDACLAAPWTGGIEDPVDHHAVETARGAVLGHLPRAPGTEARFHPTAALAVVWLAASPPQGLFDLYGPSPTSNDALAYVAADVLLYRGLADPARLPPGATPVEAAASLIGLLSGTGADGLPGWLPGHAELADGTGSLTAPPSEGALLDAVDRAAARAARLVVAPNAIPASVSCNIDYAERPPARDGGFTVDPESGGVLFAVGPVFWGDEACYARLWVDRTP